MKKVFVDLMGWVLKGIVYTVVCVGTAVFTLATLPFWLPFELIRDSKGKKRKTKSVRFMSTPKFSPKMTGQQYELYCAKKLGECGYKHVYLTPGSGDYGADVIGFDRRGNKICFQCKMYKRPVGISAVQEVLASKYYYNADGAAVVTTSTFTPAARKLADSGGVTLIEHFYDRRLRKKHWVDRLEEYDALID